MPQTLEQLLSLDDADFLVAAYRTVLGRDPDAEGLAHYRAALERGRPRLQVLWTLRASPEGRDRELSVPGLDEALRAL
jgi:hypothetical protein